MEERFPIKEVWPLLKTSGLTVFLDMPFEQYQVAFEPQNRDHLLQNLKDIEAIDELRALYEARQDIYNLADHKLHFSTISR